jgi:hypothetical protein
MIVARVLQQNRDLYQGYQLAKMINESLEALTRLLKREGGTALKTFVPLEQGAREKTSHMPKLAHIDPHIEGFTREQRHRIRV